MSKLTHEIEIEVRNPDGLHMRPAMEFVDLANSFESDITVSHRDLTIDAKSIMQMTMLAATHGTRLKVIAVGVDSDRAVKALQELVEIKFSDGPEATVSEKEG